MIVGRLCEAANCGWMRKKRRLTESAYSGTAKTMWEAIVANRRRSAVLIAGMAAVLFIIGYAGGEVFVHGGGLFGLLLAIAIFGIEMIVYFTSAESILMSTASARELKCDDSPQLFNVVDEMRLASGLNFMPRIYLIDDP